MQSKRFGVAWVVHQTLPLYARRSLQPDNTTGRRQSSTVYAEKRKQRDSVMQALAITEAALAHIMPCRFCRASYAGFRQICDAPACFGPRLANSATADAGVDTLEKYYFTAHNLVNAKLKKPVLPPQQRVSGAYARANDAHTFRCALVEWLAMIAMNYRSIEPQTAAEKKATQRMVTAVAKARKEKPGSLWRAALQTPSNTDITPLVQRWIAKAHSASDAAVVDRNASARAWIALYIDALCSVLETKDAPERVQQCAAALRKYLTPAAFMSSDALLTATHAVKERCVMANEQCEALSDFFKRIGTYRASLCAKGTCR